METLNGFCMFSLSPSHINYPAAGALYLESSTVRVIGRATFTNNGANSNGGNRYMV